MQYKFFVYAYFRPHEESPFYVGKGTGDRHMHHISLARNNKLKHNQFFNSSLQKLISAGLLPRIERLAYFINEDAAYEYEAELINLYGRRVNQTGCLDNIECGGLSGRAGFTGQKHTAETLTKMRGRTHSAETRALMSKPKSEQHRQKIADRCSTMHNSTARWKILTPSNEVIEITNLHQWCKIKGLNPTPIYRSFNKCPVKRGKSAGYQALEVQHSIFVNKEKIK